MKLSEAASFLYNGNIDPVDQKVEIFLFKTCVFKGSLLEIPEKLNNRYLNTMFDHGTVENRVIKIFIGHAFTDL